MQTPLNDHIIKQLSKGVDEGDLIYEICERNQLGWDEARDLIAGIKAESEDTIVSRQLPIKTFQAVATLIMGLTLLIVSSLFLVDLLTLITNYVAPDAVDLADLSILRGSDLALVRLFMRESRFAIPIAAVLLVNGLAMIFGSLLGMRETWAWLIDRVSLLLYRK
jgi:hypothetical protein